jgi:transcription elongation factor GreA-like protein
MVEPENDEAGQGREGALAALYEVANGPEIIELFGSAASAFQEEDYQQLIALAWRHQFDEDRTKFKRELRELQEHLSQRIVDRLELSE